jgi:hypothetical protein
MRAVVEGREVNLPDFLIVGAPRCGTTSLYLHLKQRPEIFLPSVKEPHFFAFDGEEVHYENNPIVWRFEEYEELYRPAREGQVLGDTSPGYLFYHNRVIEAIQKYVPHWQSLKIVIILRDPVERAFSHYSILRREGRETRTFEEAVRKLKGPGPGKWALEYDYIRVGMYFDQVRHFLDVFPEVRIYLFDDLERDTKGLFRNLLGFLGLEDVSVSDIKKYHTSQSVRYPKLSALLKRPNLVSRFFPPLKFVPVETRAGIIGRLLSLNLKKDKMNRETECYLRDLYREDILKLQGLIGRDLSAWLK